jgi:hypothetical protein
MGPALVTYITEPYQYAQIGETARFFCEGFIGKYCLFFWNTVTCIRLLSQYCD